MNNFFTTMIHGADDTLREEHAWLLKYEARIVRLIDGKYVGPVKKRKRAAQTVYDHLMKWGAEFAWFTKSDAGLINFADICDAIGQDTARAIQMRREFFRLPFPPKLVYFAMRKLGARDRRRNEARS